MKYDPEQCRINDTNLLRIKNIHKGKRAVIVGNGPSLKISDLNKLKNEITFASNRIFLAFDETKWRPTYYTMCDAVVARENLEVIKSLPLTKIFSGSVREYFYDDPLAIFVNFPRSEDDKMTWEDDRGIVRIEATRMRGEPWYRTFARKLLLMPSLNRHPSIETLVNDASWPVSWNLIRGARAGHSVINLGLKAAFWMGIREIFVIGCDHNFLVPDTETGEVVYQNKVILSQGEINHFHPDYRKQGEKWTVPKLDIMAEEFGYARRVYEASGGTIKNASRFSKLEVWDKVDFDSIF